MMQNQENQEASRAGILAITENRGIYTEGLPDTPAKQISNDALQHKILSVADFLKQGNLKIPEYQRPYKWELHHVQQLLQDIERHQDKSCYRLGTVVLHHEKDQSILNIVDGQQRTITLLLCLKALIHKRLRDRIVDKGLYKQLNEFKLLDSTNKLLDPHFDSEISHHHVLENFQEIQRQLCRPGFPESLISFLLNSCQLVVFTLDDISEAFQFFDSQNARGRDLEPHDLLKAYHLREFSKEEEELKANSVAPWEDSNTAELAEFFGVYLYRIRQWSSGNSARYFSKAYVKLFKGVNLDTSQRYPYVEQLRLAHHFIDHYNHQFERKIDANQLPYPFQLDQTVINGRRFFELISHYQAEVKTLKPENDKQQLPKLVQEAELNGLSKDIFNTINSYPARNRTGDKYTRSLFDCLLLFYVDKFGYAQLDAAIEKIFVWSYSLRLKQQVVQLASLDNHVLYTGNLFKMLTSAVSPNDFLRARTEPHTEEVKATKSTEIQTLFKRIYGYQ